MKTSSASLGTSMDHERSPSDRIRACFVEVFDGFWLEVARELEPSGWDAVYWIGPASDATRAAVQGSFREAVIQSRYDGARGIWPEEVARLSSSLDKELLHRFAPAESLALRMLDRMDFDGRSFTFTERATHVRNTLRTWKGILEHFALDVIVFQEIPGLVHDYILLWLASQLGIETMMFSRTWSGNVVVPFSNLNTGLLTQATPVRSYPLQMARETTAHLEAMRGSPEEALASVRKLFAPERPSPRLGHTAKRTLDNVRTIRNSIDIWSRPSNSLDKVPQRPIQIRPTRARLSHHRRSARTQQRRLEHAYESLTQKPNLGSPYVLLALHYQPEITTLPIGGAFTDQVEIAHLLSTELPGGWRLLVKEHPTTFKPGSQGNRSRSRAFYEELASIPAVQLVPIDEPSLRLVDSSEVVATVSGTIGWEAVARGTPTFIFGAAWYWGCEGVFAIGTRKELREAFARVDSGEKPTSQGTKAFVSALNEVSYPATTHVGYLPAAASERSKEAAVLASALRERYAALHGGTLDPSDGRTHLQP